MKKLLTLICTTLLAACGAGEPVDTTDMMSPRVDLGSDAAASPDLVSDMGSFTDGADSADFDEVNLVPVANDDFRGVSEGSTATIDVVANDVDAEGDILTITAIEAPMHGVASFSQGAITYEPRARYNGHDVVRYTVSDAGGLTDSAALHITTFAELDDPDAEDVPQVVVAPPPGLRPEQLAVVINLDDDYSVAVGEAYAQTRQIPASNVIRVSFDGTEDVMSSADFATLRADVDAALPPQVQAFALTWIAPYRVDCMSITSAFALGYDEQYCGIGAGCQSSAPVDTFDSYSDTPFDDHAVRPAMMLALTTETDALELIQRGVDSDASFPRDTGYLVRTSDSARSVRWPDLSSQPDRWMFEGGLDLQYIDNSDGSGSNVITDANDVLFYFTGLTQVAGLDSLTFRPGAAADHLTSFGGRLTATSGQMSIVRWLEAGATGSYGTVVEPCNYTQKFPRVSTFLDHYYRGESLIEAYWKSVNWPGEGVFIGEPLARPFGRVFVRHTADTLEIDTSWLEPFVEYELVSSPEADGPFERVGDTFQRATVGLEHISVAAPAARFYMIRKTN